jgi:hypothetical protein
MAETGDGEDCEAGAAEEEQGFVSGERDQEEKACGKEGESCGDEDFELA